MAAFIRKMTAACLSDGHLMNLLELPQAVGVLRVTAIALLAVRSLARLHKTKNFLPLHRKTISCRLCLNSGSAEVPTLE